MANPDADAFRRDSQGAAHERRMRIVIVDLLYLTEHLLSLLDAAVNPSALADPLLFLTGSEADLHGSRVSKAYPVMLQEQLLSAQLQ